MTSHYRRTRWFLASAAVVSLALAACQKPAQTASADPAALPPGAMPLNTATPAGYAAPAPTPSALPAAPACRIASAPRARRYRYIDNASALNDAFGDSPPDYAVDYQGTRPWIWRAHNGAYRVVEQVPGGERYYYYDAGAAEPFLIRDPQYTYAYDNGELVVVYDAYGRPVTPDVEAAQAEYAGRYLYWARALYQAALNGQREAAYAARWQARQAELRAQQDQWRAQQQQDQEWRAWHEQNAAQQEALWRDDRSQRQAYVAAAAVGAAGAVAGAAGLFGHHDAPPPPVVAAPPPFAAQGSTSLQPHPTGGFPHQTPIHDDQAQQALLRQQQAAADRQQAAQTEIIRQHAAQQELERQQQAAAARQQEAQAEAARQHAAQQEAHQAAAQQELQRQQQAAAAHRQQLEAEQARQAQAQQMRQAQAQAELARQREAAQARQQQHGPAEPPHPAAAPKPASPEAPHDGAAAKNWKDHHAEGGGRPER